MASTLHVAQVGSRFGRWTVVAPPTGPAGRRRVECTCDCGTSRSVLIQGLTNGRSRSCGCLSREVHAARKRSEAKSTTELADAFWGKLNKTGASPGACWLWPGYCRGMGYGHAYDPVTRRAGSTHRIAYRLAHGHIPKGAHILHLCDTPACCNPAHLIAGDNTLNVHHKLSRNRQARSKGEADGRALLRESDVLWIRVLARVFPRRSGVVTRMAESLGVHQTTISAVITRRTWSDY